jgi:peroxiredoxin
LDSCYTYDNSLTLLLLLLLPPADPWVMRDWAKNMGVDTKVVHMMADGEGMLHSKLGGC